MGDRVTCMLRILGSKPSAELLTAIEAAGGELSEFSPPYLEGQDFEFDEVNYGNMDTDLFEYMQDTDTSFRWMWGTGGGFGEGVEFYNGETGDTEEFSTNDSRICLTIDEMDNDPERIEVARKWQKFGDDHERVLSQQ